MKLSRVIVPILSLSIFTSAAMVDAKPRARRGFALALDGRPPVFGGIQEADGGRQTVDVVTEKIGGDYLAKKQLGKPTFETIQLTASSLTPDVYEWIEGTLDGKRPRKSGSIVMADYDRGEQSRLNFKGALLTDLSLPALDADNKAPAPLTIAFRPLSTDTSVEPAPGGKPDVVARGAADPVISTFSGSWFDLYESGEYVAFKASGVSGVHVHHAATLDEKTQQVEFSTDPRDVQIDNITVDLDEEDAADVRDWFKQAAAGKDSPRSLGLNYLDARGRVLFQVRATVRPLSLTTDWQVAPNKLGGKRLRLEMYCESIRFDDNPR